MIHFNTTNDGKYREVASFLHGHGIEIERERLPAPEVQADTLEEVVRYSLDVLAGLTAKDVMVDDSGFFVDALGGFPGVYSAYTFRTIGIRGLLRLMEGVENRQARFETVMGLRIGHGVHVFTGACPGTVALEPRGKEGFGFDPIFVPHGEEKTFAEMAMGEKNAISHRGNAANKVAEFLKGR